MKKIVASLLMLTSIGAFASTRPCINLARQKIYAHLAEKYEDSDCEVKLKMARQSEDEIAYKAKISCVDEGGFFNLTDYVVLKYKILGTGKASCSSQ